MSKEIQEIIKRQVDFWGALIGLVILAIPFLIMGIAIKIDSKGPVFFRATRVGKDKKLFLMYKFRSMIKGAMNLGLRLAIAQNDFRITRVGSFLRKCSLDELPQLINVLKGEMSFVGPRPPLPHQVEKYTEWEKRRLEVRPGITGWAQVNGRNLLTWKERIKYDIWYVDNYSIGLDFKILFKTSFVLFSQKGLYGKEGITRDYE